MIKVAVVGLGIIGGSVAGALKQSGKYIVGGQNRSHFAVEYALNHNIIDEEVKDITEYDVVIVALPPDITMNYIEQTKFKDNAIVADICGVKKSLEDFIYSKPRKFRYVGTHPMAGKEVNGVENSSAELFKKANMVLVSCDKTEKNAYDTIYQMTLDMGFGRIMECNAEYHDHKIAYTSQLAHIVSNAYVKNEQSENCLGFTGGSFQDMTRIAAVEEDIWTELYRHNRNALLPDLQTLIARLSEYEEALKNEDYEKLRTLLRDGKLIKQKIKK